MQLILQVQYSSLLQVWKLCDDIDWLRLKDYKSPNY